MSFIRKQIFLICQCLGLSHTSTIFTCTCRVSAWRGNRGLRHTRDTAVPKPRQDFLHKACHEGQAAADAPKNVQRIRRQSRADALGQASDSQSSPSTHSSLLVLDAAVGERLLLPVQSRRLQCPPQKCSGSAECAFHALQVLAWPTLS